MKPSWTGDVVQVAMCKPSRIPAHIQVRKAPRDQGEVPEVMMDFCFLCAAKAAFFMCLS